jgi:hypothetical protein
MDTLDHELLRLIDQVGGLRPNDLVQQGRLDALEALGLVQRDPSGFYRITPSGKAELQSTEDSN